MTAAELRFVGLVAAVLLLSAMVIFDPLETVDFGRRSIAALVLGPLAIAYAIVGLVRGRFPEMADATRGGAVIKFWFCAATFLVLGLALTIFGAVAFAALQWA